MNAPDASGGSLGATVKPLRTLFVWAMLGYAALNLFFAFLDWIIPAGPRETFTQRSYFANFANLYTVVLPLVAVLIATHVMPVLAGSKLIALVALAEYAVTLLFGAMAFLVSLGYTFQGVDTANESVNAFGHIVMGLAILAVAALAGYAVLRVFTALGGTLSASRGQPSTMG